MKQRFFQAIVALCVLLMGTRAYAHATSTSSVTLDLQGDDVDAELSLPLDQLGMALHLPAEDPALRAYLLQHVGVRTEDGRPYRAAVRRLAIVNADDGERLSAELSFTAPSGAPAGSPVLRDDAIVHTVVTHRTFVSRRRDFEHARLGSETKVIGVFSYSEKELSIDRSSGSRWAGLSSVFRMGMRHIAEGTDHLLFLIVLLLGAPRAGLKRTLKHVVAIVSSFTLGHSLSLAVGALGWMTVPTKPVEVAIAVSILVTAVHAWRPIFPGREPLVGALFGLVHGLAFATALGELGLRGATLGLSLLAFNGGIEVMQLAVVLLVVPPLVLLSRTSSYGVVTKVGAIAAGLAAVMWICERSGAFLAGFS